MKTTEIKQNPTEIDAERAICHAESILSDQVWPDIESTYHYTFERVIEAFLRHKVGDEHFSSVTGYGHSDMGREITDKVFADALQAEAALVRTQIVSGTHAISIALNGCLKRGDTLLSITGAPYDTLEEVIGIRGDDPQSLKAKGVNYREFSIFKGDIVDTHFGTEECAKIRIAKVVLIQRSRGYSLRPTLKISEIQALCQIIKNLNPKIRVIVDNCYGEFTEINEPTTVGADLIAGSLIKNPGGGIVPTGGYIAGKKDLVDACASVLTCPGIGAHGGYTFELTRTLLQGLYLAPGVVREAKKGMTLAAYLFGRKGYTVIPQWQETRGDIIQVIHLGSPEKLARFCRLLQSVSPVNSAVTPIPANSPGYEDQVVMAGGTFMEGATSELSADAPMREPYVVFLQGGLTYAHTRYALKHIINAIPE